MLDENPFKPVKKNDMTLLKKTITWIFLLLPAWGSLYAQDLHNSLFYMNPLHMNPAFSGAFEGTFRIGGIYRDQARTVVTNAYSTPSFYVDAPVVMVGKRHWVGVGGLMFQDQAGAAQLRVSAFQLSAAFHYALDKKSDNVLALGVQWGRVSRSLENVRAFRPGDLLDQLQTNTPAAATDDQVLGGGSTTPGSDDPMKTFSDVNAGLLFRSKVSKTTNYNVGFSVRHITTPSSDYNFGSSSVDLPMRLTAHAQFNTEITSEWSVSPELYFASIGPASQIQVHGWTGYMLKPEKNIKLNMGLGYRLNDAAQMLLGIDYGDLKAAIAYDLTLSALRDVNSFQGGFEIGVYYVGKIYKKPPVKPVIIGPHL
jgi:type IX secretion system PorP/SprF family membrane protein